MELNTLKIEQMVPKTDIFAHLWGAVLHIKKHL